MRINPLVLSQTGQGLIFAHANGYPPEAYRSFLDSFREDYSLQAIYLRPFWPGADPDQLRDWRGLRDDYLDLLASVFKEGEQRGGGDADRSVIGMGHSVGAMATLMTAIYKPEYFRVLVLIEPVLYPPWKGRLMRLLFPFKIMRRIHPLLRRTLKRKTHFADRYTMFENYRKKSIFQDISDQVLWDYVEGLADVASDGSVKLKYSPEWEMRVYETAGLADRYVWKNLPTMKCPVLVLRGENSTTLRPGTQAQMVSKLPNGKAIIIPQVGHLLPLERPRETARHILDYLDSML
jgi:pimeloyl-ACP methyl ester carboxylesterase